MAGVDESEVAELRALIQRMDAELSAMSARIGKLESDPNRTRPLTAPNLDSGALTAWVEQGAPSFPAVSLDDIELPFDLPAREAEPLPGATRLGLEADRTAPMGTLPEVIAPLDSGAASSLEALIGGQLALWIGSAAVFLALAFGLAWSWQSIPPWGREVGDFALALAFIAGGTRLRGRGAPWFADGLVGTGLALAYLGDWAGYAHHGLFSVHVEFFLMVLTTLAGVGLAVRNDAMAIALLATLGGFATPYVAAGPASDASTLLGYIVVLNLLVLGASLFRRWVGLAWLGLVGTALLAGGTAWHPEFDSNGAYAPPYAWRIAGIFSLYFLEFAAAAVAYGLRRREENTPHDVLLLVASTSLYAVGTYAMLQFALGGAHAAFPLALALAFAGLYALVKQRAPGNTALAAATAGLVIFFLTVAPAVQLEHAPWLAAVWVAEGALLGGLGQGLDSRLLRGWGQAVALVGAVMAFGVLFGDAAPGAWPVPNARAGPMAESLAATLFLLGFRTQPRPETRLAQAAWLTLGASWLARQELVLVTPGWLPAGLALGGVLALASPALYVLAGTWGDRPLRQAGLALGAVSALAVATASLDDTGLVGAGCTAVATALVMGVLLAPTWLGPNPAEQPEARIIVAYPVVAVVFGILMSTRIQSTLVAARVAGLGDPTLDHVTLSAVWLAWGALLLTIGLRRRRRSFRRIGLGLLAISAVKVLLLDLSGMPTPWRVAAAGGLGVVLIATSWLYSRNTTVAKG